MQKEMEKRVHLLEVAQSNRDLQEIEKATCTQDIMYFFKNYLYTDKNASLYWDEYPEVLPFIPYPYQEECIQEVWASIMKWESVFIEKSRQMGFSWLIMAIFVYWFVFHNHKYLVLSQKQDDVDKKWDMKSLFEKARFMLNNLPEWMLPKDFMAHKDRNMKYMSISREDWTWSITWESANPNASRWWTYKAIFPDEFAFQMNATTINRAMMAASPCRIYTSTPNGRGNEHYRMRQMALEWKIKGLRYHWSDHPLYTQEWYNNRIASMDKITIAQELEIDYDVAVVGRVYPDFPSEATDIQYNPDLPLFVAIDNSHGWTDPNAIICIQPDWPWWNIIDYCEINSTPQDTAALMSWQPKCELNNAQYAFFNRYKNYLWQRWTFISDPFDTKSAMGNSTILDDYKKVGIHLVMPMNKNKQEQILKTRSNLYRMRYNANCLDFATAILNARYPERKEWSQSTKAFELPIHDWTSHARTALEYFVTYMDENKPARKNHNVGDYSEKRNMVTGEIIKQPKTKQDLRKMWYIVL